MKSKIVADQVSKTFRDAQGGETQAVAGISLHVREGEFLSIVGPSGCGKTTFIRMVHGLVPPSSGSIAIGGAAVRGPHRGVGFVFQADSLLPWRTILRNVTFGLDLRRIRPGAAVPTALEYLALVGLQGFEHRYPHQLSGGMRQRANLARALAIEPEVLLMDEPFAALDAMTREIMQVELLRICGEARRTVLFVTHQIEEAVFLGDRVAVFSSRPGRIKAIFDVDIVRPRQVQVKRSQEFARIVQGIWQLVEEEVRAALWPAPGGGPVPGAG